MKNNKTIFLFLIFISLTHIHSAQAQLIDSLPPTKDSSLISIFEYLSHEKIQKLTIKTDLKKLIKSKKYKEPDYQKAIIQFVDTNSIDQELKIKVRVRGKRRREYCTFPPTKLKFPKKVLKKMGLLEDFNKLKIVNKCSSHAKSQDYVLREYLIYKMFNILTDRSFRVKLIQIDYVDENSKLNTVTQYGFIIENTSEMAARLGGVEYEEPRYSLYQVKNEATALQDVFQFMIGNTDYRISAYHNVKMVKKNYYPILFPVPYDFDYSAIVHTKYSAPAEGLGTDNILERYFLGYCEEDEVWEKVFQIFLDKEDEIFQLIEGMELLSKKSKKFIRRYVRDFYKIVSKKGKRKAWIIRNCKD